MKFGAATVFLSLTTVSAFAPAMRPASSTSRTAAAVATSFEEDLALTLKVILDHEARSATVSKDQMLSQMKEAEEIKQDEEPVDISVPYNAAARLAYEAAGGPGDFATFEKNYIEETVAMVTAKKAERDGPKVEPAPAAPAKKEPVVDVDISIPYDAAAKLAYEASNKKMDYALFKEQYEANARSAVMAKGDLSVNYDSAALLSYEASDRSLPFDQFKSKYEAEAIAQVIAKKEEREAA